MAQLENYSIGNELEDKLEAMKTLNLGIENICDEHNSQLELKCSQKNSEDVIKELQLSEMIVCGEVSGNSNHVCIL